MNIFLTYLQSYIYDGANLALRIFLGAAAIIYISYTLVAVNYPFPLDYGEAPLIDQARRLSAGENIYQSDLSQPPYTISNYPPLYVLSLTPFAELRSGAFTAGRVISSLSAIVTALTLGLIILRLTQSFNAALVTSLVFIAVPYIFYWSNLARVDTLALALSTLGLYVIIRWSAVPWGLIGGTLLLVAAAYTRQSYVLAAPLAALVWLWGQDRRDAYTFAGIFSGVGVVLFGVLTALTGGGFFVHIVTANINTFSFPLLLARTESVTIVLPILLVAGLAFLYFGRSLQQGWNMVAFYLLGGLIALLTSGKIGSHVNYFFELSAGLSLATGALIFLWHDHRWRYGAFVILLTFQVGLMMQHSMDEYVDAQMVVRQFNRDALIELSNTVSAADGPILADEYMGLLTLRHKPLYLQPFERTELAKAGRWDQAPLLSQIENQAFPLVMIYQPPNMPIHKERWTNEMLAAIDQHYIPTMNMGSAITYEPANNHDFQPIPVPIVASTFSPDTLVIEEVMPLAPDVPAYQVDMSIDPQNPDQLAAIFGTTADPKCAGNACKQALMLATSLDGGQTWQRQSPFSKGTAHSGQVSFGADNRLYVSGIRRDAITLNWSTETDDFAFTTKQQIEVTKGHVSAKPWLHVDFQSDTLYLSYANQYRDRLFIAPTLTRSGNAGEDWSPKARADQAISLNDIEFRGAAWPDDIQVLLGQRGHLALVWTWAPEAKSWPRSIWMAVSEDDGDTFLNTVRIGETWGPIKAVAQAGQYYLLYRTGTELAQSIALARSDDQGKTWQASIISDSLFLGFDVSKTPGLHVIESGLIDVVFYAKNETVSACNRTLAQWQAERRSGWIDRCHYDIYYTFSTDNGTSFSQPARLYEAVIPGEQFVQIEGVSQIGSQAAIVGNKTYAYPVWIDGTTEAEGWVMTTRIER
ncbi:MAG: hypothetical protein AAF629_34625 [Chloroflexota bacterium]